MTLAEIKEQVMFQTNNDAEDLGDYEPHINDYVNEGYDRLVSAWNKGHVIEDNRLEMDSDEPEIPLWTHRALVDYATWLIYRNGNPQKQQRGMAYLNAFNQILSKILDEGGAAGLNEDGTQVRYNKFRNIPV